MDGSFHGKADPDSSPKPTACRKIGPFTGWPTDENSVLTTLRFCSPKSVSMSAMEIFRQVSKRHPSIGG
jgi:hypothetical protein